MRTFHTGGVAGADITHGLPRVVELFEARKPKGVAQITNVAGTAGIEDLEKERKVTILDAKGEEHLFRFPRRTRLLVEHGEKVDKGRQLNEGSLYPAELLEIQGRDETERYLVREVQEVYKSQGVDINDKHLELIVRQMLKRVRIEKKGGTDCLPGSLVDRQALKRMNDQMKKSKAEQATGEQVILGITKASLATDSFLSAASFQETTKVLTDAALEGKVDRLLGLKENVIIGKLIPAATGLRRYRTLEIEPTEPVARPSADEIGLLDEEQLAAELGLDGEGLEGLGADITGDFGDDFGADFDMANGEGAQRAAKDGEES
jgi:DNA-directed RNA polymerase subunit beta'